MDNKYIGILTSGGDASGMHAAIRAVTRAAIFNGFKVKGLYRGYEGLIAGEVKELTTEDVSSIIQRGGTILKTARSETFTTPEGRKKAYKGIQKENINALIIIGGDGSLTGARIFAEEYNVTCIGLPGTIDNDLYGTDFTIGYDTASITDPDIRESYHGEIVTDRYVLKVPMHAHGTANIGRFTSSASLISETATRLYDRIVNPQLLIRRINLTTNHVMDENRTDRKAAPVELDLFTDYEQHE